MSSHESPENGLQRESLSQSIYKSDEVGAKLSRLRERTATMVADVDGFMDAEVAHESKVYMQHHLYCVLKELSELLEGSN